MKAFSRFKLYPICYSLFAVLLLAAFFRLYGLNWDQNHHLHPDERFLTMVVGALKWPKSLSQYFNPQTSPLNPYNANFGFFVYGTLPLKIVKAGTEFIKLTNYDYNNIALVGRLISAIFDLGIVLLIYKIGQKIFNEKIGVLASFLYSISVLPIQLSHFFAVDTFLVFFLTLSFYLLISIFHTPYAMLYSAATGCAFGLALACKISALLFLPIITFGYLLAFFKHRSIKLFAICSALFAIFAYFFLRLADPRIFADNNFFNALLNSRFIANIKELRSSSDSDTWFPPAIQWIKTKPIIFPLKNMILWGFGLPLGILTVGGVIYSSWRIIPKIKKFNNLTIQQFSHLLVFSWIIILFAYQGIQFAKPMRYFYPIYPFLAILTANFSQKIIFKKIKNCYLLFAICFLLLIIWPLSFMAIYSRSHSRVIASQWIYENIPSGSTISCEHWDDCLPLGIKDKSISLYQIETLALHDQDTPQKWQKINQQLERVDYLIMSSNRLWGSIPRLPEKYPTTTKFYQDLFAENLDFQKVAEIASYPKLEIGNWKLEIRDEGADESFTVYDHPKVLIFKKKT